MSFGDQKYEISVKDQRSTDAYSESGRVITDVYAFVYDAGTKTLSTLYSDDIRTSLTNPISRSQFATDDMIKFFSASTSHDIYINTAAGDEGFYAGITPSDHLIQVNTSGVKKHLVIPFTAATAETDSGVDLPLNTWVSKLMVDVTTADTSETLDVGLLSTESGGDANGFLSGVSLDSTGFIAPIANTAGTTETYVSTYSYGALMGPGVVGTNAASDFGNGHVPGHVVSGSAAQSIVYNESAGATTGVGYIHLWFEHLR